MKSKTIFDRINFYDLFRKPIDFPKSKIDNPIIKSGAKLAFKGGTAKESYEALVSLKEELRNK